MLSVVILDNHEPKVIELTYEQIHNELRHISGSEVIVSEDWFTAVDDIKNSFVCFVEPDCLVSPGYFEDLLKVFEYNKMYRTLAMVSSATAVCHWHNKIYGFSMGNEWIDSLIPNRHEASSQPYESSVAYFPGSIIRTKAMKRILPEINPSFRNDLVLLSTEISLALWGAKGIKKSPHSAGNSIFIDPNATYVTTEDYVGMVAKFNGALK